MIITCVILVLICEFHLICLINFCRTVSDFCCFTFISTGILTSEEPLVRLQVFSHSVLAFTPRVSFLLKKIAHLELTHLLQKTK